MTAFYIIVAVLIILNIIVTTVALRLGKRNRILDGVDDDLYDENGNHIYYDRKLIRHLKSTKNK